MAEIAVVVGVVALAGLHVLYVLGARHFSVLSQMLATYVAVFLCLGLIGIADLSMLLGYFVVYLLAVMAAWGIVKVNVGLLRGCSGAMILFYLLLVCGAFYGESEDVLSALKWKVIGFLTIVAGISVSRTSTDLHHFRKGMRLLIAPLGVGAALLLLAVIRSGGVARLDILGNPNTGGIISASSFCLALYLALWDNSRTVRIWAIAIAVALGFAVLATGSRSAAVAAVVAGWILAAPLMKRPSRLLGATLASMIVIWVLLGGLGGINLDEALARLLQFDVDTGRQAYWADLIEESRGHWLFGVGTHLDLESEGRVQWANMHSIYIQVFYESGLCGSLAFALSILYVAWKSTRLFFHCTVPEKWLAYALIALPMSIGLFESAPLLGISFASVWWGMGLGLLDQLATPEFGKDAGLNGMLARGVSVQSLRPACATFQQNREGQR